MKNSSKLMLISVCVGLSVWVFNALLDSIVFDAGTFSDMLWAGLNPLQITHRFITVSSFIIFGIVISYFLTKLNRANEILIRQKEDLDKRVTELDCLYGISILNEIPNTSLENFIDGIVSLLELTLGPKIGIKINFDKKDYFSSNYNESNNKETYNLKVNNELMGFIELSFFEKSILDTSNTGRKRLMNAVAERTGKIIERRSSKMQLKEARDNLRLLAAHLHSSREKERQAIAREIHDELGQVLTALKINLSVMVQQLKSTDREQAENSLELEITDMKEILDVTINRVRKLVTELRPEVLDNLGLVEALIWQTNVFREQTGIPIEFECGFENIELSKDASISLFRIYQESLTNITRHSGATAVKSVFYKKENNIILKVEDNGKGILSSKLGNTRSFGLLGMKERAMICGGVLNIDSEQGKGTIVEVTIPEGNFLINSENL